MLFMWTSNSHRLSIKSSQPLEENPLFPVVTQNMDQQLRQSGKVQPLCRHCGLWFHSWIKKTKKQRAVLRSLFKIQTFPTVQNKAVRSTENLHESNINNIISVARGTCAIFHLHQWVTECGMDYVKATVLCSYIEKKVTFSLQIKYCWAGTTTSR